MEITKRENKYRIKELLKSQKNLREKLLYLKKEQILKYCFSRQNDIPIFESLEFYGDSVLHLKVTQTLLKHKPFMTPFLLSRLRNLSVSNQSLSEIFDFLNLEKETLKKPESTKKKADVVESMLGELHSNLKKNNNDEIKKKCEDVMNDLVALISYVGEIFYYQKLFGGKIGDKKSGDKFTKKIEKKKNPGVKKEKKPPQLYLLKQKPLPYHSKEKKNFKEKSKATKKKQNRGGKGGNVNIVYHKNGVNSQKNGMRVKNGFNYKKSVRIQQRKDSERRNGRKMKKKRMSNEKAKRKELFDVNSLLLYPTREEPVCNENKNQLLFFT